MNIEKEAELPLDSTPTFEGPTKVLFRYLRGTRAKPNDIKSAGAFWLVSRQNYIGVIHESFHSGLISVKGVDVIG